LQYVDICQENVEPVTVQGLLAAVQMVILNAVNSTSMKLNLYPGISVLVAVLIINAQQTKGQINNSAPLASSVNSSKQNASAD
jgi:hypothetical protein